MSEDQLFGLRQTGSAALYAQKFQSYAALLNINDEGKCLMFFGGLKSDIRKACTMAERTSPFYALDDQAITFDQLSYQHSKRESGNSSKSGGKKRHQNEVPTKDSSSASNPKTQPSFFGHHNSSLCACGRRNVETCKTDVNIELESSNLVTLSASLKMAYSSVLQALIDSGATLNFINEWIVTQLQSWQLTLPGPILGLLSRLRVLHTARSVRQLI
jgi:hypothetical protein